MILSYFNLCLVNKIKEPMGRGYDYSKIIEIWKKQ